MGGDRPSDRFLEALIAAFVSCHEADLPPVSDTRASARLRQMIQRLPRSERALLNGGFMVLQSLAILRFGRPVQGLGVDRARRLVRSLEGAPLKPLRRLHYGLKMLCQFSYFADEGTWVACDYRGPWLGRLEVEVSDPPDLGGQV